MKSFIVLSLAAALNASAAGCKDERAAGPTPAGNTPARPAPASAAKEGDAHAGPMHDLGSRQAGGHTVKATQFGALKPGGETVFELVVTGGAGKPSAVRVWVGTEAGEGSAKVKAGVDGDDYDVHVDVPATLPAGSELWVEVETAGTKATASFPPSQ